MGCDIHGYIEVKQYPEGKHAWWPYSEIPRRRNYAFFATIANVRNNGHKYISKPKGMPKDASIHSQHDHDEWGGDAHSASYLTYKELKNGEWSENVHFHYSEVLMGTLEILSKFYGEEDVRMVFWFDN